MGSYRVGPPTDLILDIHRTYSISTFVETGSYEGDTANWAADYFNEVYTIEFGRELYETAIDRFGNKENCTFIYGDSGVELPKIMGQLSDRAVFWLDAHYSGGDTFGAENQCPLRNELEAIGESQRAHYVLIDDARYFLRPPPEPYDIDDWPSLDEIVGTLLSNSDYYIVVVDDVIVCVPEHARDIVVDYCRSADRGMDGVSSILSRIKSIFPGSA